MVLPDAPRKGGFCNGEVFKKSTQLPIRAEIVLLKIPRIFPDLNTDVLLAAQTIHIISTYIEERMVAVTLKVNIGTPKKATSKPAPKKAAPAPKKVAPVKVAKASTTIRKITTVTTTTVVKKKK